MGKLLRALGWVLAALIVLLLVGWVALRRNDIPFETLEARYKVSTSHFVDLPGGLHVHYRDEGKADGPTLVLVHGFSASTADWEGWGKGLGDRYHIVSLDLPGHGLTRAPAGYAASTDSFVATVEDLAKALHLGRFTLAGNSMGGGVAWNYALAHPERLDGLVLVDAAGWPSAGERKGGALIFNILRNPIGRAIIRDLDQTDFARQGLDSAFIDKGLVTPALVQRYTDMARGPGHREILVTIQQGARGAATKERLAAIKAPTLVMFGEEDHLIPAEHGRKFADAIPQASLILYPGVGHVPMEQIPARSAADLAAWMDGHRARPEPASPQADAG